MVRKLRLSNCNFVRALAKVNRRTLSLGNMKGEHQRLAENSLSSFWFEIFFVGIKNRMEQIWKPNKATSFELLMVLFHHLEEMISETYHREDKHDWVVFQVYCVVSWRGLI